MRLSKLLAVTALVSLVAMPAIAAPVASNPAASLSVAKAVGVKSSSSVKKGNKLEGTALVVAIVAAAAVVGGVIAISDGNGDSN